MKQKRLIGGKMPFKNWVNENKHIEMHNSTPYILHTHTHTHPIRSPYKITKGTGMEGVNHQLMALQNQSQILG